MNLVPGTIGFEHFGIGTALLRNRLIVPINQREYSWEKEHVLDLFHDLTEAIDKGKPSYFLGTIVLTGGEDEVCEVVDGQQRLATTTILLAAMRDYLHDRNDTLLVEDVNKFLITIDRKARGTEPRLKLNLDDNGFFHNRILEPKGSPQRKAAVLTKASHRRIELAAQLAAQHIQDIVTPHSEANRISRITDWVSYLERSAMIILLKVTDNSNAYIMFETLNDRGLKTTQFDLVKSYLYDQAGKRKPEAQQRWAMMNAALDALDRDDELGLTYLRHFVISRYGFTRERDVLDTVKAKVAGELQSVEFLDAAADGATDYVAMLTPTHAKWNSYRPSIREHIRTLSLLQLLPLRPVLLSVIRRFPKAQAEKAFRMFVFWSARFLIAGGGRSGAVETALARAAEQVSLGHVSTSTGLADLLANVVPGDVAFETAFATATVAKATFARYYLRALELKRHDDPEPEWIPNDQFEINLEHVLPQNPNSDWPLDAALVSAYTKRLGNLVLLRVSANVEGGNRAFEQKRGLFAQSTFLLTQEVANEEIWGPQQIEERQKRLASLAVQTWPARVD